MKGDESHAGGGPMTIVAAGNQPIPPATHDSRQSARPAIHRYPGIRHNPMQQALHPALPARPSPRQPTDTHPIPSPHTTAPSTSTNRRRNPHNLTQQALHLTIPVAPDPRQPVTRDSRQPARYLTPLQPSPYRNTELVRYLSPSDATHPYQFACLMVRDILFELPGYAHKCVSTSNGGFA